MSIVTLHSSNPRARKAHYCESCGRVIERGENYLRQDNVYDDNRYTWKSCQQCDIVASWVYRTEITGAYYDEGVDLAEWLEEYRRETLTAARIWVYFGRKWRRLDGGLVDAASLVPELNGSES